MKEINGYTDVKDAFDFSKHEYAAVTNTEAYKEGAELVDAEASNVTDQIMLGDAEEALRLLEAFTGA